MEKDHQEALLGQSNYNVETSQAYIQQFQLQQKDEKRERVSGRDVLSEGVPLEKESLVKQLKLLRDINKRLRSDKNEAEATELRLRKSRDSSHNNSIPVQGKSFISKIQYYPNTCPKDGKGQLNISRPT